MKIHHLSCGSMCPMGGVLMDGFSSGVGHSKLACHCLLIETDSHGLVLVDTGFGTRDAERISSRLSPFFIGVCQPRVDRSETALAQIEKLGYRAEDVRHIVLTHLDFDHAGGIDDFPEATIHLMAAEKAAAEARAGWIARGRYRPMQYREHALWHGYESQGEPWFSFQAVWQLHGLPPEILLIPLIGHTMGHAGVAVQTDRGWLLHAGDAYFYRKEMNPDKPLCTPGLIAYQRMMDTRRAWRLHNQKRLRELVRHHGDDVRVFCAHDWKEFEALRDRRGNLAELRAA